MAITREQRDALAGIALSLTRDALGTYLATELNDDPTLVTHDLTWDVLHEVHDTTFDLASQQQLDESIELASELYHDARKALLNVYVYGPEEYAPYVGYDRESKQHVCACWICGKGARRKAQRYALAAGIAAGIRVVTKLDGTSNYGNRCPAHFKD